MRLGIVIGHTKDSPGAFAAPPLRLSEYDYNTGVAAEMYRVAMERGLKTRVFTRDGVGIKGAYKEVNEWIGQDEACVIELHFNAANGKAKGTETLFDDEPAESIELARVIQEAMCMVFNRKGKEDRGLKKRVPGDRGYTNLKECKAPSVIVEPAFADNPLEAKMLMDSIREYAMGLVAGVFNYFETKEKRQSLN